MIRVGDSAIGCFFSHGDLLSDAVRSAASVREHRTGDRDDVAAGIRRGDDLQRRRVAFGSAYRHDNRAVADIEVEIARGHGLAVNLDVGQERQVFNLQTRRQGAPAVFLAVGEVGVVLPLEGCAGGDPSQGIRGTPAAGDPSGDSGGTGDGA